MKFQPGTSGNPQGRKPGTGHRQQLFNSLVEPHKEALVDTALKLALAGNESMLRLFLERMLPAKPVDDVVPIEVSVTGAKRTEVLLAYGEAILVAVSRGEMTPDQGSALMGIIDAQRKNIETTELASRLAEIERTLKQRKKEKK